MPLHYRRDTLRESARKEFEAARFETDPEIVRRRAAAAVTSIASPDRCLSADCAPLMQVNRLLVVGRDSVHQVAEKFVSKRENLIDNEAAAQEAGARPPFT